jgi:hypothetical protein
MPLGNVDVSTQFLLQNLSVSLSLKTNHFLALFGKKLSPPSQIDVERRRHRLSSALSLQTLQLIHRVMELPVQMSFVAQEFVGCIHGRQPTKAGPKGKSGFQSLIPQYMLASFRKTTLFSSSVKKSELPGL